MKKRDFIKVSLLGAAGCATLPSSARSLNSSAKPAFEALPHSFEIGAVKGLFSTEEIISHHKNNFASPAKLLSNMDLQGNKSKKIFRNPHLFDRNTVQLAGEFFNHRIFFKSISGSSLEISNTFNQEINKSFGSIENMKNEMSRKVNLSKKEGWLWLIRSGDKLAITTTRNNDNPFMTHLPKSQQGFPLIAIDLYRHSIENSLVSSKDDYFTAFWNALNWNYVSERFVKAEKSTKLR